jgi:dsRNA-specific ribonuclease
MAVEIDGRQFDPAWGRSKKEAEQKAAMHALQVVSPELLNAESS